jgi:UDP-N-acetylmuramate--alanine ligase
MSRPRVSAAFRWCSGPQALAALMVGRRGVAVAGTHGKTTTTSMLTVATSTAASTRRSPSAETSTRGQQRPPRHGDLFVVEADESDGSFWPTGHMRRSSPTSRPTTSTTTATAARRPRLRGLRRHRRPGRLPRRLRRRPRRPPARRAARGRGVDVRTYGTADDADLRLDGLTVGGTTSRYRPVLRGRRLPPWALPCPAATWR